MKKQRQTSYRLDLQLYFGASLLDRRLLAKVQTTCLQRAPNWSAGLRLWPVEKGDARIDPKEPDAFYDAVIPEVTEKGDLYRDLVAQYGQPRSNRICGNVEFRGGNKSLVLAMSLDEEIFGRVGEIWTWGNYLSFQVRGPDVDGSPSPAWAKHLIHTFTVPELWYAHAEMADEFAAKNLLCDSSGCEAVGVDISKSLPGLYWLNYFGKPYVELIGRNRLLSAPAHEVADFGNGVLVMIGDQPEEWDTHGYRLTESRVLDHLGRTFFFSKAEPRRATVAPAFALH